MRREALIWLIRGMGLAIGFALVTAVILLALRVTNVLVLVFVAILLASGLEPFIG